MKKLTIAVLAMLAFGAADVSAQASANATATVNIQPVLAINVPETAVGFTPDATAFSNGFAQGDATSSITTRGNVGYDLSIQAQGATFSYAGSTPPDADKPAGDLLWQHSNSSGTVVTGYTSIDQAGQLIGSYARGVTNVGTVDYRVVLSYANDTPGTYTLGFTYTITAN